MIKCYPINSDKTVQNSRFRQSSSYREYIQDSFLIYRKPTAKSSGRIRKDYKLKIPLAGITREQTKK